MLAAERQAELTAEIGRILDAESPHEVFEVGRCYNMWTMLRLADGSSFEIDQHLATVPD